MKVLVLSGGVSPEREVSLRSGKSVSEALESAGHMVENYDPADGYEGLKEYAGKVDCVFPILHGRGGEDGEIQAFLEKLGVKYLGASSKASSLCFDKVKFKALLNRLSIATPASEVVDVESFSKSKLIDKPYVLKPIDGGSTIDTFIVRDIQSKIDMNIFNRYPKMLLEELIEGREITVPVLGSKALPVIEIIPPEGKEFDYDNKYNGASQELCPPQNISDEEQVEAQKIAELVHTEAGVRHLSRTDIIIDKNGRQRVLEINTMPGMTPQSLFPKAARVAGMTMGELVNLFLKMATS